MSAINHPLSIGEQNKHLLDSLADAYQVALSLASWGCIVERISARRGRPEIWLQCNAEVWQFESYAVQYGRDRQGHYEIHRAEINGVLINWRTHRVRRLVA